MSDHRSLFIDEALDLLDSMNNGLLALESDATDPEAMDAVFREAHTLKGNAAAMGLTNISSLAHALEDLLEDVRSGSIEVTPELMDEIFASVDTLETMVAEVDQTGDTATDPSAEIDRLEAVFEDAKQDDTPPDQDDDTDSSLDGRRVRVELVEGGMPAVDASFVLESLDEEFDEIEFFPNRQHVEDGAFDEFFEVTVPRELEGLRDALSDHPRVESATIVGDTVESKAHPVDEKQDKSGGESAGSPNRTSVRVDIERLEELHELIEQLVTTRIRLNRQLDEMDISVDATRDLAKVSQRLQDVTTEMRLVPFETIARGFPRVVRDTARELNKEIDFEMTGTDVEVDRQLLTRLKDPLIHVLRNAVDHGIEEPEIRRETGKPPAGQLEVSVERVGIPPSNRSSRPSTPVETVSLIAPEYHHGDNKAIRASKPSDIEGHINPPIDRVDFFNVEGPEAIPQIWTGLNSQERSGINASPVGDKRDNPRISMRPMIGGAKRSR